MVWGWVHNFPASKGTFTKPIDYPTADWDTIIADWWEDVFNAVEDIEEYLLDGILKDRGDPASYDFILGNLTTDNDWHDLDLSAWKRTNTQGFHLFVDTQMGTQAGEIAFRKKGKTNDLNVPEVEGGPGEFVEAPSVEVFCDAAGKIQYQAADVDWVAINISVRGNFR